MDELTETTHGGDDASHDRRPERYFPETGVTLSGPFLAFYEHYGHTLCGYPISEVRVEDGLRSQYFQRLALEEPAPGQVRVKPLGEAWLTHLQSRASSDDNGRGQPAIVDLTDRLPTNPSEDYSKRTLGDIRYLVLHHTGAPAEVGPRAIAREHVEGNGWPGIGYHYLVATDGTIYRTQDLTAVSHHARQFNPAAVGIALLGDYSTRVPDGAQLDATADLLVSLLRDLGLPPNAVRGHREMVPTPCPGDAFLSFWKPRLLRTVSRRLGHDTGAEATPHRRLSPQG